MLRPSYAAENEPEGALPAGVPLSLPEPVNLSPGDKRLRATGFRARQADAARGQAVLRVPGHGRGATPLGHATIHVAQAEAVSVVGFGLRFVETGMAWGDQLSGGIVPRHPRPSWREHAQSVEVRLHWQSHCVSGGCAGFVLTRIPTES